VFTVIGGALLGALVTIFLGREPGFALGLLVFLATVVAVFVVRPKAAYLVIPVPALAYVAAAVLTGYLHDRGTDTSHTALAISAVQWIADGFVAMAASTALATLVAATRWLVSNRRTGLRYESYDTVAARRIGPSQPESAAAEDGERPRPSTSGLPSDPQRRAL
jgi:hypothetical protein